jgi:regulator of replication initiation timing
VIQQLQKLSQDNQKLMQENVQLKADRSIDEQRLYSVEIPEAQAKQTSANASMAKAMQPQQPPQGTAYQGN